MNNSGKHGPIIDTTVTFNPTPNLHDVYYTGIGSRDLPKDIEQLIFTLGFYLAKRGLRLRSGGAEGSDDAFERGCLEAKGNMEIYLPWPGFMEKQANEVSYFIASTFDNFLEAQRIASRIHPTWDKLKPSHRVLHGRNAYQILGRDLKNPSSFVICYAKPTGLLTVSGGTNTAVGIAYRCGIPVFNLYKPIHRLLVEQVKNTGSIIV